MQLKLRSTALRSMSCSSAESTSASVNRNDSIVAMSGMIIPAPLAMPATRTTPSGVSTCPYRTFGTVSVVMIALAHASNCSRSKFFHRFGSARGIRASSNGSPITPVEASSTWHSGIPASSAIASAVAADTFRMFGVAQFAFPAFATIARAMPPLVFRDAALMSTGAARTAFCVKTPAAVAGVSETISARSSLRAFRTPANPAAKRNPKGNWSGCVCSGIREHLVRSEARPPGEV